MGLLFVVSIFNIIFMFSHRIQKGESVQTYGRMKFPADMRIQQIANLSVVFSFMKQHVKLVSIGPQGLPLTHSLSIYINCHG
jgi:hypothetical protein